MLVGLSILLIIGQFAFDLAHWFFVAKYWNLSLKIQAQLLNKPENTRLSLIVYYGFQIVLLILGIAALWTLLHEVNTLPGSIS